MEIRAYSLAHWEVCSNPLSVVFTSSAGTVAPVAGSYHLISNGPGLTLDNLTVFGALELALMRATITRSEGPPTNQRCSSFFTPSTATLNADAAESPANMSAVMERLRMLLAMHKAAAALASGGSAQTICGASPRASIAAKNGDAVADSPEPSLRMTGLFMPCSERRATS